MDDDEWITIDIEMVEKKNELYNKEMYNKYETPSYINDGLSEDFETINYNKLSF